MGPKLMRMGKQICYTQQEGVRFLCFLHLCKIHAKNFPQKLVSANLTLFDNRPKPYGHWAEGYFFVKKLILCRTA